MRSDAPPLLPILRSRHQAELLTLLLLHPEQAYTLTELAQRLAVPASTLHREVERLLDAELITATPVGRSRLLQINPANRHVAPLTTLVVGAFGPHLVIAEEFAAVDSIECLLIYGSWAARYPRHTWPPAARRRRADHRPAQPGRGVRGRHPCRRSSRLPGTPHHPVSNSMAPSSRRAHPTDQGIADRDSS